MDQNVCQDSTLEKLESIKENLIFIVCRPYKENYYYYSINNVDNYKVIDKYELKKIISFLDAKDINQLEVIVTRFKAFVYIHEKNIIKELVLNEDEAIEQILKDEIIISTMKKEANKKDTTNKYEDILNSIKKKLKHTKTIIKKFN